MLSNELIDIVERAIQNSEAEISKIETGQEGIGGILSIKGMSTPKVRHFLNNVVFENSNYLEIGSWHGSTLCSALYKNKVNKSISIDNFSEFEGNLNYLVDNIAKFIPQHKLHISEDSFSVDLDKYDISDIDIYFYDGDHTVEGQKKALTYYINGMAKNFIFIVDDWNWLDPRTGTFKAIEELGLKVHLYRPLPDDKFDWEVHSYHNGLGVFVLEK